jgi:hypothetical protein
MSQNFCTDCGTRALRDNQEYCGMCGASLQHIEDEENGFDPYFYQFTGQKFEGFADGVFTHHQKSLVLVQSTAQSWFNGSQKSATGLAKECKRELPAWLNDVTINEHFLDGIALFDEYEPILWSDSRFGTRFLDLMTSRGAQISHGYIGRQVAVENEQGETVLLPLSTPIDLYNGRWCLSDGREFAQNGQVFRSKKDGSEIVYWYIDAFARTRPSLAGFDKDLTNQVAIPYYLQTSAYLAETPFPSALTGSMMVITRNTCFGEENSNPPRPAIRTIENGTSLSITDSGEGKAAITFWSPELTQFGYVFTESMTDSEIYDSLPAVCDGLPKVLEIIVDGYANWAEGTELSFQDSLISDICFRDDEENFKFGAIIPGAFYGNIALEHNAVYDKYFGKMENAKKSIDSEAINQCLEHFDMLAFYGVGSICAHAANTLASNLLELNVDHNVDSLLAYFRTIDVDFQNINALSNLILMKLSRQEDDEALALIKEALSLCKSERINLNTLSYFTAWDGSVEDSIITEIFESALNLYAKLGLKEDRKKVALQTIEYCEDRKIEADVLEIARRAI